MREKVSVAGGRSGYERPGGAAQGDGAQIGRVRCEVDISARRDCIRSRIAKQPGQPEPEVAGIDGEGDVAFVVDDVPQGGQGVAPLAKEGGIALISGGGAGRPVVRRSGVALPTIWHGPKPHGAQGAQPAGPGAGRAAT